MLIKNLLLPGVVVPMVCAAVALAAAVWSGRRGSRAALGGGSIALGAAFLSAYVAMTGWPRFPPVESTQRLFYWVAVISLIAFAWGRLKGGASHGGASQGGASQGGASQGESPINERAAPWPLRAAAIAFLLWGMLRAPIENTWSAAQATLWLGGLLVVGLGMIRAVEASFALPAGRAALEAAGVRLAVLGGGAVVLGLSGTARLAQLMGAVACGALVVEVLALRLRRRPWLAGDAMVLVTAALGLLLGGYFYAEVEPWPAVLMIATVLLLGFGSRPSVVWRWIPLLPLVAALALVGWSFLHQEEDPYGDYGSLPAALELGRARVEGNVAGNTGLGAA